MRRFIWQIFAIIRLCLFSWKIVGNFPTADFSEKDTHIEENNFNQLIGMILLIAYIK